MEDFSKYLDISGTLSLICCMFWIFSPAEGNTISEVVGSKVMLHCGDESLSAFVQLTWKMNGHNLFTFDPLRPLYISREAHSLNISMSLLESQMYALIIERAQMSHTGNYTCDITTIARRHGQKWELIITEPVEGENWNMLVTATAVPFVCCLIFIVALTILKTVSKWRAENTVPSPAGEMEDIYENCLEADVIQRLGYNDRDYCVPTAH